MDTIPDNILEIEKQIHETKTPEELKNMKIVIARSTSGDKDSFSYLHKAFILQKMKLGMRFVGGKSLFM